MNNVKNKKFTKKYSNNIYKIKNFITQKKKKFSNFTRELTSPIKKYGGGLIYEDYMIKRELKIGKELADKEKLFNTLNKSLKIICEEKLNSLTNVKYSQNTDCYIKLPSYFQGMRYSYPTLNFEIKFITFENELMNVYRRGKPDNNPSGLTYTITGTNEKITLEFNAIILEFLRFKGENNSKNAEINEINDNLLKMFNNLKANGKNNYYTSPIPIPIYKYDFDYNGNKYIVFEDYLERFDYLQIPIKIPTNKSELSYKLSVTNGLLDGILSFQKISCCYYTGSNSFIHGNIDRNFILIKKDTNENYPYIIFTGIYGSGYHDKLQIPNDLIDVTKNPFLSYNTNDELKKQDWFGIGIIILELILNRKIEDYIELILGDKYNEIMNNYKLFNSFYKNFIYLFNELIKIRNNENNELTDELVDSINYENNKITNVFSIDIIKNTIWNLCVKYVNIIDNSNYDVNLFSSNIDEIKLDYNPSKIKKQDNLNLPSISSKNSVYEEPELPADECSKIEDELNIIKENKKNINNEVKKALNICVTECTRKEIEELQKNNNIDMNCVNTCNTESKKTNNYKTLLSLIDNQLEKSIELSKCKTEAKSKGGKKQRTSKKLKKKKNSNQKI